MRTKFQQVPLFAGETGPKAPLFFGHASLGESGEKNKNKNALQA
jgi:hypothetical protein